MKTMFRLLSLTVSLALLACGGSSNNANTGESTAPDAPQTTWTDDTDAPPEAKETLPDAPPFVAIGETITYRVKIRGFAVGEFIVRVGDKRDYQGKEVIPMESSLQSYAAMKLVREVHDESVTYMDTTTGSAVFFRNDVLAGPDRGWVEVTVGDGELTIISKNEDGEKKTTQKVPAAEPLHDMATMLMRLRSFHGEVGERGTVNVFRTSRLWRTQIEIGEKETLETDLGTFPAIRMDGISRIMTHEFEVEEDRDPKSYRIWISDDGTRLPLVVEGDTEHGAVRMEVASYERDDQ